MPGSPERSSDPGHDDELVLRFGSGSRLIHWVHAVPFLLLLITGLTLFFEPVKAAHIDGYRVVPLLHVLVGIAFIASPMALFLLLRKDRAAADDVRRIFNVRRADVAWARYAIGAVLGARVQIPPTAKFNAGEKANAVFTIGVTLALMLSGAVLAVNFFTKRVFAAGFVERIFPLHDLFMLIALPVVVVHIYLGSLHPGTRESLRGMVGGLVRRDWARGHHSLWVEEIDPPKP